MIQKEIKTIDVHAKEWFDKINGNSYFSAKVIFNYGSNNPESFLIPFQYGYGSQYQTETLNQLVKKEIFPDRKYYNLHTACEDNSIVLRTSKETGCNKRDLYGGLKSHNAQY